MKTRKNKWGSKAILIILALLILGTSLTGLALAKGEESARESLPSAEKVGATELIAEEVESINQPNEEALIPANNNVVESAGQKINKEQKRIDQIKKKTDELRSHRLRKADTFNFTKADIEKLLLSGSTVEDIYLSDQIANEWLVSPDQLVELKRKSTASLDEIALAIQEEKEARLKELLALYPTASQPFSKTKISTAEKVEVLEIVHESGSKDVKKENLDKAIQEVSNNQVSREHAYSISDLNMEEDVRQ